MKIIKWFFFLVLMSATSVYAKDIESVLGKLPIQDSGRLKPFDTFARESLQMVYGRRDFKGKSATEIVMTWLLLPEHWDGFELIRIDRKDLKQSLGLASEKAHFSPNELFHNEKIGLLFQDLESKRKVQEKLNPYWQAVQTLESQISVYRGVVSGATMKFVPQPNSRDWYDLRTLPPEFREQFDVIAKAFIGSLDKGDVASLETAINDFTAKARALNPENYPDARLIEYEHLYNQVHPFQMAWIAYLVGALIFLLRLNLAKPWLTATGVVAMLVGFALHTFGFYLRMSITGRPPVSNMYESVIWVSWGAILFSFVLEHFQKKYFYFFAANVVSVICLIVADIAPNVLDPSMQPLQPVLRSNMWLTVHVLTITLSYSVLFLAFILGDVALFFYLKDEKKHHSTILTLTQGIYRSMQVGFVLLFAGTVLGGVWADYSWGRFWGWDPKETWAFIALMGYIAILHGRLAGWLRNFGFAVTSVVAFSLVIMAWYGVNFVLGAGLHSYGFGAGGVEYVAAFVGLHIVYAVFVITVRQSRLKKVA